MKKVKGVVSKASSKDGRFGIEIAGTWYNGFGTNPTKSGDEVEFEYVENPGKVEGTVFRNVNPEDVKILSSSKESNGTERFGREPRVITRTACVDFATRLTEAKLITLEQLKSTAEDLFIWINE